MSKCHPILVMIMLFRPEIWIGLVGICSALCLLLALIWSIAVPERRIWPPIRTTTSLKITIWLLTIAIFASAFFLGILDWNTFGLPAWLRWSVGILLILFGNLVVWRGVFQIGMAATSGEVDELRTDGIYRWSRNPQYVADMVILAGWGILAASIWALPIMILGWVVLILAPFAEEPWLEEAYGDEFRAYKSTVRRFL